MRSALTFLLLFLGYLGNAQTGTNTELTVTDITVQPDFNGSKASFRGFHLGMSKAEAIEKLKSFKDFTWKIDAWNTKSVNPESKEEMRIYASLAKKEGDEDPTVLYLIWKKGSSGMSSLVLYHALAPMLKGNTPKLFTPEALDDKASFRTFLHGAPEQKTDNIGITTYDFSAQHFQLISMPDEGKLQVWFKFE